MKLYTRIQKKYFRFITHFLLEHCSQETYLKYVFRKRVGYKLNLQDPQTFCEKIQWLKLNRKREDFTLMVDKIEAKKYAASIIGQQYIIPTIAEWDNVDSIDWEFLPDSFVLKATSDSGGIVICKDKKTLNKDSAISLLSKEIKRNFSKYTLEYPYSKVSPRILAEKLMINGEDAELKDYKFYCFNGRVEYCQVIADRVLNETIDFFDRDWNHQVFYGLNPKARNATLPIEKPVRYEEMVALADKIASAVHHPFVRVDLYNINAEIYFGEITFFPASGMGIFTPHEWDLKLGQMINLEY